MYKNLNFKSSSVLWKCIYIFSTFVDPDLRKAMGEQAVSLAKAVGYDSAG